MEHTVETVVILGDVYARQSYVMTPHIRTPIRCSDSQMVLTLERWGNPPGTKIPSIVCSKLRSNCQIMICFELLVSSSW